MNPADSRILPKELSMTRSRIGRVCVICGERQTFSHTILWQVLSAEQARHLYTWHTGRSILVKHSKTSIGLTMLNHKYWRFISKMAGLLIWIYHYMGQSYGRNPIMSPGIPCQDKNATWKLVRNCSSCK